MKQLGRWLEEVDNSPDGCAVIDISHEFERIFSRNIITVSFGEDISDEKFEIMKFTDKTFTKMAPKMVSMREALHEIFEQLANTTLGRFSAAKNMRWQSNGVIHPVSETDYEVDKNCERVRAVILKYVQDRKSGKRKTSFEGVDVLSLFFENPEIFTDEFIVDELCDFFVAASSTTQYTTQTLVSHLIKDPKSLAKLRTELDALKSEQEMTGDLEKDLAKLITLESIQDLEYQNWTI